MRRLPFLAGLSLVVLLTGSVAGASTQNLTLSALIAEATWSNVNPDTGAGEAGGVQVAREDGVVTASLDRSIGKIVLCEGGNTPDPSDDYYGFVGKEYIGDGTATLSVGRTYRSARASGTITADVMTFDECSGDFGSVTRTTISFTVTLAGTGPLIHESTRSTLRVPSEVTAQQQIRGTVRFGAGTVKLNGVSIDADGTIGQLTLRVHEAVH